MGIISNIYLLIFLPLISSLFCQIFAKKLTPFFIAIAVCLASLILSLVISFDVLSYASISNDFNLSPLSIALEFKLDVLGAIFLPMVIFLKMSILLFYRSDIKNALEEKSHAIFYSIFLINLFGLIGIFTTDSILNLFLFFEIYALSFFAITSISCDKDLLKLSFSYFCLNAISSLLILFCFFAIYLSFDAVHFSKILDNINLVSSSRSLFLAAIFATMAITFLIKFFPFWLYFKKLKNIHLIANFLTAESLFIKANIGLFLGIKFIYLLFGTTLILTTLIVQPIFIILSFIIVLYSLVKIYKQRHLKVVGAYLCLNNLGFMLAAMTLNTIESLQALFFYLINFNFINLFIFLFASFLKRYFATSSIDKIALIRKHNSSLLLPLKLAIIFIAAAPFTILFYANWHLSYVIFSYRYEALIFLAILLSHFIYLAVVIKVASALFINENKTSSDDLEPLGKIKTNLYLTFFTSFVALIYLMLIASGLLNDISLKFASYLLLNTI